MTSLPRAEQQVGYVIWQSVRPVPQEATGETRLQNHTPGPRCQTMKPLSKVAVDCSASHSLDGHSISGPPSEMLPLIH